MQAQRIVTKIDANPLLIKRDEEKILRVGAYCRVSTDSEDQLESYQAQVEYYTDAIAKNPRWKFAKIYADEGLSGTGTKNRQNFNRMISDCEKGRIDYILTKSVARFARNTVDSLRYIRKLKALGIGIFFEQEHLDTLKADNEMIVGLHSVFAQAESETISANVRWGIHQRMMSGTFAFRYNILGYRKGEDGNPEIVPEEAEVVRTVYNLFLEGNSVFQIQEYLKEHRIKTFTGKDVWSRTIIRSMLTNERYAGDLLAQKTYVEDCISHRVKQNRGERAKYLVMNNHPAIIDRDTFKAVQAEMARRSNISRTADDSITEKGKFSGKFALTELLVCGECGKPYRRKAWILKGENVKVWRCLNRIEHGKKYCSHSVTLYEDKLHEAIRRGLNRAMENRQEVMDLIVSNLSYAITGRDEDLLICSLEQQIKNIEEEIDSTIQMRVSSSGDPIRFQEVVKGLAEQMSALKNQLELERAKLASNEKVAMEIERIKRVLSEEEMCFNEYEDNIVRRLVSMIKVMSDGVIKIVLKGGVTIEEMVE